MQSELLSTHLVCDCGCKRFNGKTGALTIQSTSTQVLSCDISYNNLFLTSLLRTMRWRQAKPQTECILETGNLVLHNLPYTD